MRMPNRKCVQEEDAAGIGQEQTLCYTQNQPEQECGRFTVAVSISCPQADRLLLLNPNWTGG